MILMPDDPLTIGGQVVRGSTHRDRSRSVSFVRWLGHPRHRRFRGPPDHVSTLSSPGTWPGIRPVIHDDQTGGAGHALVVSRCLSAAGIRFLVILFPPGIELSLRSAYRHAFARRTLTGFPCFARTSCDRGGCPLYSGDGGAHPDRGRSTASARRITAPRSYAPPQHPIDAGLCITKHQPRVQAISPVRSSPRL